MKRILTIKVADVTDCNSEQIEHLKRYLLAAYIDEKAKRDARFFVVATDEEECMQTLPAASAPLVFQLFPFEEDENAS